MKTVFFEIQEWEKEILVKDFPDAVFVPEPLDETNVASYTDSEIISPFIYSKLSAEVMEKIPGLRCVTTRSTGFDHVAVAPAKERGVVVCNVPEYGSRTVAEFTFGLMLMLTRHLFQSVRQSKECIFDTSILEGVDIWHKKLGIVGLGKIGLEVAKIAHGFEMDVLVSTRTQDAELAQKHGFRYLSLDELLQTADIVTLHLPLIPETKHVINAENIMKMKKGSYLINTSRGGLIETEAIIQGLEQGILAGVGLDVLEEERDMIDELEILASHTSHSTNFKTLCMDHALIHHPRVLVTPHNAFNSREALTRILSTTGENIRAFIQGSAINTVG